MIVSIILIVINVAVFLILSFGGATESAVYMVEHGAAYTPYIVKWEQYYRLFTSMFLHFGIQHLINNMLTLYIMGRSMEPVVGKVRFILIYLLSGLGGNLLTIAYEMRVHEYPVSAGASGAVFGLTGALLALTIIYRGQVRGISLNNVLIIVALNLYIGFTNSSINNAAHIGGLVTGLLLAFLMVGLPRMWNRRSPWNRR